MYKIESQISCEQNWWVTHGSQSLDSQYGAVAQQGLQAKHILCDLL